MAKEFTGGFYKTKAWQKTRNAYVKYRQGLCEECLAKGLYRKGEIVHHRVELTPENIDDPNITLSWDNLELVCRECHLEKHEMKHTKRFTILPDGSVTTKNFEEPPFLLEK